MAVELLRHDLFSGLPGEGWDLVVSNPPYVRDDELASLARDVVDWEPDVALVDRGQTEALVRDAARALRPGGTLVLEAHEHGAAHVAALLEAQGYADVRVTRTSPAGDRVVEGRAGA